MRTKLAVLFAIIVMIATCPNLGYAAFPVSQSTGTTSSTSSGNQSQQVQQQSTETVTAAKETPHKLAGGGGKSQLIAALLCFFLGGLGIHRFYLGYTWQGVVQLLTGGGCGLWALIDFIRILTGDLKPKSGNYDQTF